MSNNSSSFRKYQGAGNDFILIDDRALQFNPLKVPYLCHRKFGIGADGLILLQNDSAADFRMRFYNNDGSQAESCGNGLRCLAQFIRHLGLAKNKIRIATEGRIVEADFIGENVRIQLGAPRDVNKFDIEGITVHSLNTGVPHAVIFVPDVHKVDVAVQGAFFRYHPQFQPRGTNVNFAMVQEDGSIYVRTYERGLEGEPLACGTGGAAAAVVALQTHNLPNPIRICYLGGEIEIQLEVEGVCMIGPAVKVFEGFF